MASVLNVRRHAPAEQPEGSPPAEPPPKRRRWRLLLALALVAMIVWLAPAFVAHTRIFSWILASATSRLDGTITVESASLGWFSPIVLRDVRLDDAQGEPVLQTARVEGSRSLLAILLNPSLLGQFQLDKPELTVRLRDDGSNIEDVLAEYLKPQDEPAAVSVGLKVVDGRVLIVDKGADAKWELTKLQLAICSSADPTKPLRIEGSAVVADAERPGKLAVKLTLHGSPNKDASDAEKSEEKDASNRTATSSGKISVETDTVPMAMVQGLLDRWMPRTRLVGRLSSDIQAEWGRHTTLTVDLAAEDFALATPALGKDRLRLRRLEANCQMRYGEGRVHVENASLTCDLGSLSAEAVVHLDEDFQQRLSAWAAEQTFELDGQLDLVALAETLPNTLRIRPGTKITSGTVQFSALGQPGPDGTVWEGSLESSNLTATRDGRRLTWQQPIRVTLNAHNSPQGPFLDHLQCVADFLQVKAGQERTGAGETKLSASAQFDLKKLTEQVEQFVDLGQFELDGEGRTYFVYQQIDERFGIDGEFHLHRFRLATPGRQPWSEESVLAFFAAQGRNEQEGPLQLLDASLNVKAGDETLSVELAKPVADLRNDAWPLELQAQGNLADWPARLQPWVTLDDYDPSGAYSLHVKGVGSSSQITVDEATLVVERFQFTGPGVYINQPSVGLQLVGGWDREGGNIVVQSANLSTGGVSVLVNDVEVTLPEQGPWQAAGTIELQADLAQIGRWFRDPNEPASWQFAGQLVGRAKVHQSPGRTGAELDAKISDLVVVNAQGQQFAEPTVHLGATGEYVQETGTLHLTKAELASTVITVGAQSRLAMEAEPRELEVAAELAYDLEKLGVLLRPYLGPQVYIAGRGKREVSFQGPMTLTKAEGRGGFAWQSANVYGFPIGPGRLDATLADGVLRIKPLDLTVSQGRMQLAPEIRFSDDSTELIVPGGSSARQIQITPGMCQQGLKYVAPVLAGVTQAAGTFSIELDACRIPLEDPEQGELSGRLIVHSVAVGPGPLVREMAMLLGRASPAKLRRESVVNFRLAEGRVHHEGLELVFPEMTIRTHGSVGLDQTLSLVAEMPVPPKWQGANPLGTALRNQIIRLPIGGTLKKPRIDRGELDRLARQFLRNATINVLEDEVGKQLDRLFGPRGTVE